MSGTWADPDVLWGDSSITWTGDIWTPPPPPPPPAPTPERPLPRLARWQFIAGDEGRQDHELTAAKARRVAFHLDGAAEASFTVDGRHEQAGAITELVTDVHAYREGQRLFRGRVGPTADDLDTDTHKTPVTAIDYRGVLARRQLYDDSQLSWAAVDQAEIAWGLITQTQIRSGGDLGITRGLIPAGVPRDRSYQAGKSIGEAIQQLSEVLDGFDWDINGDLQLNVFHPQRGADNKVVLDFGGAVTRVARRVDTSRFATAVRLSGADTINPEIREAADLATRPEGRWDAQYGHTDIGLQTTLADRADWRLDEAMTISPAYTVTLRAGFWEGAGHIWLGDTCRLIVQSGRLNVDAALRVHTIAVDIGDSGEETVALTLGGSRPDFRRRLLDVDRRLEQLERR